VVSTDHTVTVVCGTVASGQSSFTTTAAASGPTVAWTYKLRPSTRLTDRGVTNALVSYNVVGEAADTLSSGCSTDCTFSLPLLSGQTYELQHAWRSYGLFGGASTLNDGLVNYWPLTEASGARSDTIGAITLTDNATVGSAAGIAGLAASFVYADSEYLSNAAYTLPASFTVSAWFNLASYTYQDAIFITTKSVSPVWPNGTPLAIYVETGGTVIRVNTSSDVESVGPYETLSVDAALDRGGLVSSWGWTLVTVSFDATEKKLRVRLNNETPVVSTAMVGTPNRIAHPLDIGRNQAPVTPQTDFFFSGQIAHVLVWDRALTEAEEEERFDGADVTIATSRKGTVAVP
jgi:hypothetical protein